MVMKTEPFLQGKYGWSLGESNWNAGADENFVKFSYMLNKNIDGVVGTLPASPVNGTAYFLTTDNTLNARVDGAWYTFPCPIGFTLIEKATGNHFEFNGTSLVSALGLADKTKLDGIATGATANATNAQLRDRATHTGLQAISTIAGLDTALGYKADYAPLNPIAKDTIGVGVTLLGDNTVAVAGALHNGNTAGSKLLVNGKTYNFDDEKFTDTKGITNDVAGAKVYTDANGVVVKGVSVGNNTTTSITFEGTTGAAGRLSASSVSGFNFVSSAGVPTAAVLTSGIMTRGSALTINNTTDTGTSPNVDILHNGVQRGKLKWNSPTDFALLDGAGAETLAVTSSTINLNKNTSVTGSVTSSAGFTGSGSGLTNLQAIAVSGVMNITQGGTGGASPSSARTNLGLGTAATVDTTTSTTDATSGRVPKVDYVGLKAVANNWTALQTFSGGMSGNASGLTNIAAGAVTGQLTSANIPTVHNDVIVSQNLSVSGSTPTFAVIDENATTGTDSSAALTLKRGNGGTLATSATIGHFGTQDLQLQPDNGGHVAVRCPDGSSTTNIKFVTHTGVVNGQVISWSNACGFLTGSGQNRLFWYNGGLQSYNSDSTVVNFACDNAGNATIRGGASVAGVFSLDAPAGTPTLEATGRGKLVWVSSTAFNLLDGAGSAALQYTSGGISLNKPTTTNGGLTVNGAATVSSTLGVTGAVTAASFTGSGLGLTGVGLTGSANTWASSQTFSGDIVAVSSNIFGGYGGFGTTGMGGDRLRVNGTSTFYGGLTVNGTVNTQAQDVLCNGVQVRAGGGLKMYDSAGTTAWGTFSASSNIAADLNMLGSSAEINIKSAGTQFGKMFWSNANSFGVLNGSGAPLLTNDGTTQTIHKPTVVLGNITSSGGQFNGSGAGLTFSTGTFTLFNAGTTTAGTGTYTNQAGKHTKIGNLCFCRARLTWSAHSGAAGAWRIGGLPFTAVGEQSFALGYVNSVVFGAGKRPTAFIGNGQTYMDIYLQDDSSSVVSQITVPPAGDLVFEFFYEV